jgi:ABC-type nitrate/sulfonate/bicarbonate transport system substrate-binding protein
MKSWLQNLSKSFKYLKIVLIVFIVLIALFETREVLKPKEPLRIAISNWIGYMPIVYAIENGWIKKDEVELVWTSGLEITSKVISRDMVDAMFATQYDALQVAKNRDIKMAFATNISGGSDVIMSNCDINTLRHSKGIIVNLEASSLGSAMLDGFLKKYSLNENNFLIFDRTQTMITTFDYSNKKAIAITYPPNDLALGKKGFTEIDNAKSLGVDVLDGLFVNSNKISSNKKTIEKLKISFDKSVDIAVKNPYSFYQVVKPYLGSMDYDEFKESTGVIEWASEKNRQKIEQILSKSGINKIGVK